MPSDRPKKGDTMTTDNDLSGSVESGNGKIPAHLAPMVRQFREAGWTPDDVHQAIKEAVYGETALCADYCETEPDGICGHGYPSVLKAFGFI
jgi:hypothetical protein